MSYDPNRERKRKKQFIMESIVKFCVIIFVALILAAEFGYRDGDLNVILEHASEDFLSPRGGVLPGVVSIFPLYPIYILKFLAVGILGWFVWFVSDWSKYMRGKNMRPGEEHGSAAFNLAYGQMEHDYIMSPRILKEKAEEDIFNEILGISVQKEPVQKAPKFIQSLKLLFKKRG